MSSKRHTAEQIINKLRQAEVEIATKKGLTLRPETWREVLPAIQALLPEEETI